MVESPSMGKSIFGKSNRIELSLKFREQATTRCWLGDQGLRLRVRSLVPPSSQVRNLLVQSTLIGLVHGGFALALICPTLVDGGIGPQKLVEEQTSWPDTRSYYKN